MKRSEKASLLLMGAVPFVLYSCSEPTPGLVYNSISQCMQDKRMSASDCEHEFSRAHREHARTAPTYQSYQACAADFGDGNCESSPVTSGSYVPRMVGALISDPSQREKDRAEGKTVHRSSQPLYMAGDDRGSYRSADNDVIANRTGSVTVDESNFHAKPNSRVLGRGGFGRVASHRSGG